MIYYYNDNKYFYCTSRCITTINIFIIQEVYNDNKYSCYTRRRIIKQTFHYIRRCIMTINFFVIHLLV